MTLEENFWSKVEKTEACWNWTAGKMARGYGLFRRPNHSILAHRWSWEFAYGSPPPEDKCVCHHCDNPSCVRPDHLFLGTDADNNWDKSRKMRHHNQKKTHCPRGHEYTPENIIWGKRPNGKIARQCRACMKLWRDNNREKVNRKASEYYYRNRDKILAKLREKSQ